MALHTLIYYPSTDLQSFVVPIGTTKLHVECVASRGANINNTKGFGGYGGRVICDLAVTSRQTLYIMVGDIPSNTATPSYNASDIRTSNLDGVLGTTSLNSRLVVAGGGGSGATALQGSRNNGAKNGGAGGGITGGNAENYPGDSSHYWPGSGGTQSIGGISSNNNESTRGKFGLGGQSTTVNYCTMGCGGAGWYGGGGGAGTGYHSGHTHAYCAGGGGGSSYTNSTYCTNVQHEAGINTGAGYVKILYESSENIRYNQLYKGSTHIAFINIQNKTVKRVYKGSELIYLFGFENVVYYPSTSLQTFIVPLGIDKIKIDCVASKGIDGGSAGGKGARVQCILSVTSGQTLYIAVGKMPTSRNIPVYNASDIRTSNSGGMLGTVSLNSRLVVAGGGGSGAGATNKPGGNGGYSSGSNSSGFYSTEAIGGSQSAGGTGAQFNAWSSAGYNYVNGGDGTFGLGGTATSGYGIAGAGGAGWYGGGGGIGATLKKVGSSTSGGAGGSSYTNSIYCTNVQHERGYNDGAGYVIISMVD